VRKIPGEGNVVIVQGLDQFRKELVRIAKDGGPDGRDLLKEANYKVAAFVIDHAKVKAATIGRMQSAAAQSMKPSKSISKAMISAGGTVEFFYGAEFGAKSNILRRERKPAGWAGAGRWRGYNQFDPWKKPGSGGGYFLYPTMREKSKEIVEMYGDELDKVSQAAFPD
jgi:hypothetical protein